MSGPHLCFVSAAGGSIFMEELLEVVADAVRRAGGTASTVYGCYPPPEPQTVYVVVPHEYFVVTPVPQQPTDELRRRTIGFGVEHPGTSTFERVAQLMPSLGGAVDINAESTAELRRRGIRVRRFQLGYSPLWDAWGGPGNAADNTRTVDVTYLGTAQRRRSRLLGSYWRDLDHLRTRLLTPPHEPMRGFRVDFLPGEAKLRHLANSRVLLNLHREQSVAVEWVRILEAICNGCVVVSEPCRDLEPLLAGEHLVIARPAALGAVAAALVGEPQRERKIRAAAYDFVRTELDMRTSAESLLDLADAVLADVSPSRPRRAKRPADRAVPRALPRPPAPDDAPLAVDTPPAVPRVPTPDHAAGTSRQAEDFDRALKEAESARLYGDNRWSRPPEMIDADGVVDVLIVQRTGEPDPSELAVDLAQGTVAPRSLLLCADGVRPPRITPPHSLLRHELPTGRGYARNALLDRASAPWLLVLDAGMRASPYLLRRLLDATGESDVVSCPVADPVDGLVNALPAEARRLRRLPYLGSGYLVRRELATTMAGWPTEPTLDGLEDHVFWRSVAESGVKTHLVQQILLSRIPPDPPTRPVELNPARVWRELERHVRARVAAVRNVPYGHHIPPLPRPMSKRALRAKARDAGEVWKPDNPYFVNAERSVDTSWNGLIWPLIQHCDLSAVIDLAAGHGRNSAKLRAAGAEKILILDINAENVDRCRERFAGDPAFSYAVVNGYDLHPAETAGYSLVYCFDSMVHFHREVVRSYLMDTFRVLRPGGHGFFHHSNYTAGDDWHHNPASRAYMSRELFAQLADAAGLEVVDQRVMPWYGWPALDCLSLVRKRS